MKISSANKQLNINKFSKMRENKALSPEPDKVTLGENKKAPDFLNAKNLGKLKAGPDFGNLDLRGSVPYIAGGAALCATIVGMSGNPLSKVLFATGAGAVAGSVLKKYPTFAKTIGAGVLIGGGAALMGANPAGAVEAAAGGAFCGALLGAPLQWPCG